jgi:predicted N-acyltransferase
MAITWLRCVPCGGQGYATFEDFLMSLKQSRRKNVRQERKRVVADGLRLRRLSGDDLRPHHWDSFYDFYINTTGGAPSRMWESGVETLNTWNSLSD